MLNDHWPLFGLSVRTPRLELRLPAEAELANLADVAATGVHEPGQHPFLVPWTDGSPAQRAREMLRAHWRRRGTWTTVDWALDLAVFEAGRPVGMQQVWAKDFAVLREVRTGSWLGLAYQGRGIGREMRAAALYLAFTGLGASDAATASFMDNPVPLRISRDLGYEPDGVSRDVLHGRAVVSQRLRLTRAAWERSARPDVTVHGLEDCLEMFGVA